MLHRRPVQQAFTLIELLVVISIIALLVGILLPALGAARKSAQRVVGLSNQRQIGVAMMAYAAGNKDLLPYTMYQENGVETRWWHRLILDGAAVGRAEEGSNSNLVCPADQKPYIPDTGADPNDPNNNVACSYGMNQFLSIADGVTVDGTHVPLDGRDPYTKGMFWRTLDSMLTPTELLLITEIYYGHIINSRFGTTSALRPQQLPLVHTENEFGANLWNTIEWGRHSNEIDDDSGKVNVLYVDGHAASAGRRTDIIGIGEVQTQEEFDRARRLWWPRHTEPNDDR